MFRNRGGFLALVLIPLLSFGCGGTNDSAKSGPATSSDPAIAASALINPNLASEDQLASVPGVTAEAAAALAGGRPYLTASDLHAALSGAIGAEAALAAYGALWLPINLNDVTTEEVLRIPGVGERMAHEFEEYRPYEDMDEFRHEIGKYADEDEVERLARYVYVPLGLNTASREQLMAVPGMTERMAHEFEEYRPYTDLDQFRREIGKYVDEDEVARFERYVTLD